MYSFILLATTALAIKIREPDTAAPQHCPPACDPAFLGNGVCDDVCNIVDCAFDNGDCDNNTEDGDNHPALGLCPPACDPAMLGN